MSRIGILICGLLAIAMSAMAQEPTVQMAGTDGVLETDALGWDWFRGQPPGDGVPARFLVRCTKKSGETVPQKSVNVSQETIDKLLAGQIDRIPGRMPLKQLLPDKGNYECLIIASNAAGEGPHPDPFAFTVTNATGGLPAAPSNVRLLQPKRPN